MGISLKDIFSNDEERLIENKRKKAIRNMMILGFVVFGLLILTVLYKYLGSMSENRRSQITRDIQNIKIAVLAYYQANADADLPGISLEDYPIEINVNGKVEEYRYGYYLLQSGDLREINVSLNLPNEIYLVNYKIGDVVNYKGIKYKSKNYYGIDDIIAIENGQSPLSDRVHIIKSVADLNSIRQNPSGYYILSANIDMAATGNGEGWNPIPEFNGILDGRGYTISNLKISRTNQNHVGLFGNISNSAKITNLTLENVEVIGGQYTGALAGSCTADVSFVHIKNAKITGYNGFTGGLVGSYSIGTMNHCTVNGMIDGDRNVGGVIGALYGGILSQVSMDGKVTASDTNVGGLIGLSRVSEDTNINESFALVDVNGKQNLGGLFGALESTAGNDFSLFDSYVKGSIETGERNIGGIVGQIYTAQGTPSITFKSVYADVGIVVKGETSGGFAGECNISNSITQNTLTECYWKKDLAPGEMLNDIGVKSKYTTIAFIDKTPSEMNMMRTYTGWDFEKVWSINERSNTPVLKWESNYILGE